MSIDMRILKPGDTDPPSQVGCHWTAGISLGTHTNKIQVYASTKELAEGQRDAVLNKLQELQLPAALPPAVAIDSSGQVKATVSIEQTRVLLEQALGEVEQRMGLRPRAVRLATQAHARVKLLDDLTLAWSKHDSARGVKQARIDARAAIEKEWDRLAGVPAEEALDEELLEDAKRLLGLPPYNALKNSYWGDPDFAHGLAERWGTDRVNAARKHLLRHC